MRGCQEGGCQRANSRKGQPIIFRNVHVEFHIYKLLLPKLNFNIFMGAQALPSISTSACCTFESWINSSSPNMSPLALPTSSPPVSVDPATDPLQADVAGSAVQDYESKQILSLAFALWEREVRCAALNKLELLKSLLMKELASRSHAESHARWHSETSQVSKKRRLY